MTDERTVMRRAFDAMLPDGTIWQVEPGGDLDKYLDAQAADLEIGRLKVASIAATRDPQKTSILSDLEIDFGIIPDPAISDTLRRQYLGAIKGERPLLPSWLKLENKLRAAGFDVRVRPNDPPVDPATLMMTIPCATVGDDESTIGNPDCRIGYYGGEWLVNGDAITIQEKAYTATVCDDDSGETTVCDDTEDTPPSERGATVGQFDGMLRIPYVYPMPPESRWQFVFWICGTCTSNQQFLDWNMEFATVTSWDIGAGALIEKTLEIKSKGIRALKVQQPPISPGGLGPYVEQTLETNIDTACSISVDVCDLTSGREAGLMVCDKDSVWDTVGIETTATADTLTYSATNGISAVRLYALDGTGPLVTGDYAIFDQLIIDGATYTNAQIGVSQRARFKKMVLRYKPIRVWAGLLVDWIDDAPVPGPMEEDDMTYRFVETTVSGNLDIDDTEVAVHIILYGTSAGFTVTFDDATNFSDYRMYRFTNNSSEPITFQNYDGSITDELLPGNVLQATLTDILTQEGDWNFVQHIAGLGTV